MTMKGLGNAIYQSGYKDGYEEEYKEGYKEGVLTMLFSLVKEGALKLNVAAREANLSEAKFSQLMECAENNPEEFEKRIREWNPDFVKVIEK